MKFFNYYLFNSFDISNDLNELNKINANYCVNETSYRLNKKYKCEL